MKLKVITLGCKVNIYESEILIDECSENGFNIVYGKDKADIIVINSCTVTHASDRKTRSLIEKAKRESDYVVVMGCYANINKDILGVDLIIKNEEKSEAINLILNLVSPSKINKKTKKKREKTRAFLKIQDGCNAFCTFCIIPYARGRIKSTAIDKVVSNIKKYIKEDYKEIVLTGIHISSYGKDIGCSLKDLFDEISKIDGLERLRLGSLEPRIITKDFMEKVSILKSFCPHFHLSLQSGSDKVLREMNRRYTKKEYLESVNLIRKYFPLAAITTDIICGFPTETNSDFQETLEFINEVSFSDIHGFSYSRREGTKASSLIDLNPTIVKKRTKLLIEESKKLRQIYLEKFIGKEVEVLFEKNSGITREYNRVITNSKKQANSIEKILIGSVENFNLIEIKEV